MTDHETVKHMDSLTALTKQLSWQLPVMPAPAMDIECIWMAHDAIAYATAAEESCGITRTYKSMGLQALAQMACDRSMQQGKQLGVAAASKPQHCTGQESSSAAVLHIPFACMGDACKPHSNLRDALTYRNVCDQDAPTLPLG